MNTHQGRQLNALAKLPPVRERLYDAQAKAQELKNGLLSGQLVAKAEVETVWCDMIATSRTRLLAIPARISARHPGNPEIVKTLTEEIMSALETLAEDSL